ncbi:MAG TPA: glycine betaine ABC transporter substrate-binding protein [Virgibacillus sp.]|nr:glycine betaine ABC transporter substrate-binding protein [Virgibacillus sp.]HLR69039.1 glycine betaine ABC transporter substrate-binding protein [Virgibacillus sp.]
MRKLTITLLALVLGMVLSACSDSSDTSEEENGEEELELEEIIGIEPGSGTMNMAEETVDEYNLDMELVPSSEPAMITELQEAIKEERPIVVTLWQPHWAFDKYDLKILDDPKEIIGVEQKIHTIVRKGLKEEHPSAYQFLDNFYWDIEDMNAVMAKFGQDEDVEPRDAAKEWIEDNREKADSWMEGVEPVENETIELAYINWDTELSSTNVVTLLLEELGFDVELTTLDMGIAFKSVAQKEVDGMLIAWLPGGASTYMEQYADEIVDLGPNLEGAKQGFVVPAYVDIDSNEDLPTK